MSITESIKHKYNLAKIKANSAWENLKLDTKNKYHEIKHAIVSTFKEESFQDQAYRSYKESEYIIKKVAIIVSTEFNENKENIRHEFQLDSEKELVKERWDSNEEL